jgi:hypothetical protein
MRQIGNEARTDDIVGDGNNRCRVRRLLRQLWGEVAESADDVHVHVHELCNEGRQGLHAFSCKSQLHPYVAAIDVALLAQPSPKRFHAR